MKKSEVNREVFSTRVNPIAIRKLKYLSADEKKPLNVLLEEAIQLLLQSRGRK
jgi:hypothetical protein